MQRFSLKLILVFVICLATTLIATPATADWNEGDGHKMHWPQLPDPVGWDLEFVSETNKIGDDWVCSQTGPVNDIHIWLSWQEDNAGGGGLPGIIDHVGVEIYDNIEPGVGGVSWSRPGTLQWGRVFDLPSAFVARRPYGSGNQGWYSPQLGMQQGTAWQRPDHTEFEQLNIFDIEDPFIQQEGETYWLVMWVAWDNAVQNPAGWKTADLTRYPQNPGQHFMDDAVWFDEAEQDPNLIWKEIVDPQTLESLDLAFVITPEPTAGLLCLFGLVGLMFVRSRRR
jgi:hypothetical protein